MVLSGNQDLVVTEDNRVVLSGNQYLGVVISYIRLISGSNLILIWFN